MDFVFCICLKLALISSSPSEAGEKSVSHPHGGLIPTANASAPHNALQTNFPRPAPSMLC